MSTDSFNGRAEVYTKARPSYPEAAIVYIQGLLPRDAVIAEVGAGTGKLTVLLAAIGYKIYAIEPNQDMRQQLQNNVASYPNVRVLDASAEATTLHDQCVDAVVCAQALHWFDPNRFTKECERVCKDDGSVIAIYNETAQRNEHREAAIHVFFHSPTIQSFYNPQTYTYEAWKMFKQSHSHSPLPEDKDYPAFINEVHKIFEEKNVEGILTQEMMTKVYSEKIVNLMGK